MTRESCESNRNTSIDNFEILIDYIFTNYFQYRSDESSGWQTSWLNAVNGRNLSLAHVNQ